MNKIELLMKSGVKNIEAAIKEAENLDNVIDDNVLLERKLTVKKLEAIRESIAGAGPYTSLRRTITRVIDLINETI